MSWEAGQILAPRVFSPVTQEQLDAYAEASGDPNPIHLDPEVARAAGLPGVIAHGMLSAAFVAEAALEAVSATGKGWRLRRLQTRFKAMTLLGDVVTVKGRVRDASAERVSLALQACNQRGEVTTTGLIEFIRS